MSLSVFDYIRRCYFCGLATKAGDSLCQSCEERWSLKARGEWQMAWDIPIFSIYRLAGPDENSGRQLLVDLKESDRPRLLGRVLDHLLSQRLLQNSRPIPMDPLFIPAPSTSGRLHGQRMARGLSQRLNLPWVEAFEPPSSVWQKLQGRRQRLEGRKFQLKPDLENTLSGTTIVLLDDIWTTGATAKACFEALGRPPKFEVWTIFHRPNLLGS
jgi:predicted amidophosphoribosyltransferase